jgi:hypothetical protein
MKEKIQRSCHKKSSNEIWELYHLLFMRYGLC